MNAYVIHRILAGIVVHGLPNSFLLVIVMGIQVIQTFTVEWIGTRLLQHLPLVAIASLTEDTDIRYKIERFRCVKRLLFNLLKTITFSLGVSLP